MRRLALLLAVFALAACGDDSPEASGEGTPIRAGETVEGTLEPGDLIFATDGSFYDLYTFQGEPLEPLEIVLTSEDFDAFLAGGDTPEAAVLGVDGDDDSAGGTNARLLVRADTDGRYAIRANSLNGAETGAYTLTVARARGRQEGASMNVPTVTVGQPVRGELAQGDEVLTDGSLVDTYLLATEPGDSFVITMIADNFAEFLGLGLVENGEIVPVTANEATGLDGARIGFTSQGGTYAVQANSVLADRTGGYTLLVESSDRMREIDASRFGGQWTNGGYGATRQFANVRNVVQREQWLEQTLRGLNASYPLPRDVPVSFQECGEPNAFYDPSGPAITYCYELVVFFDQALRAQVPPERLASAALGAYDFVMLHEAGHAMVDQLDLPITGREEDVADQFAALHLIRDGFEGAWAAVDGVLALQGGDMFSTLDFAGEHSLGPQRLFNVVCLVFGSDPNAYAAVVGPDGLPEERAVRCPSEFAQVDKSFDRLLSLTYGV